MTEGRRISTNEQCVTVTNIVKMERTRRNVRVKFGTRGLNARMGVAPNGMHDVIGSKIARTGRMRKIAEVG